MKEHNKIKEDNITQTATQTLVKEILRFNKAHNIVGRFTEKEIISLDVFDCETILQHIPAKKEILDIGSGAGLPGLIIAIHQPKSNVTMSEKNKKKAYFIKKIIRTLDANIFPKLIIYRMINLLIPIRSQCYFSINFCFLQYFDDHVVFWRTNFINIANPFSVIKKSGWSIDFLEKFKSFPVVRNNL